MFILFDITWNSSLGIGFSVLTFGSHDDEDRSFIQIANDFRGNWYLHLLWIRIF